MNSNIWIIATVLSLAAVNAEAACLPAALCAKTSGVSDIDFGSHFGAADETTNYELCVYVQNDDESNYELTPTGSGGGGSFEISTPATDLPVIVEFEEDGAPGWVSLTTNIADTFSNPNTVDENCGVGGDSAKIRISILGTDLDTATAGTYTGSIDLTTSPD